MAVTVQQRNLSFKDRSRLVVSVFSLFGTLTVNKMSPQMSPDSISKHYCGLKKTTRGLPPLAPNASRWLKFKRWMRILSLLDEKNLACVEFFAGTSHMRNEFYRHVKSRDKFVIHPFSKLSYLVNLLFFCSWGVQLYLLPVYYAIPHDLEEMMDNTGVCLMASFQIITVIFFFFIGYIKNETKTIIITHKMICKHYLRTFFIPDFIAVMGPVLHNFSPLTPHQTGIADDLEFMYRYLVLLCYVVRLKSLKRTMEDLLVVWGLPKTTTFIIDHLCAISLILHLMSSLVIAIPWTIYDEEYPVESWFKQANIDNATMAGASTLYVRSLLMTCCYFFGVSNAGYHITMPNEEITLFFVLFLGRLYTLYMIADLLRIFGLVNVSESRYENVMSMLNGYIQSKDLSPRLRLKLLQYCKYKLQGSYISEKKMFETLSDHIRTELMLYHAKSFLVKLPVFQTLSREELGALIADMQNKVYSPGDKIIGAGDKIGNVHFIKSGTVAIYHDDTELCHIEDGDTFGDIALLFPDYTHYRFTYIAIYYVELYSLRKYKFKQLLEEHNEVRKYFELKGHEKLKKLDTLEKNVKQDKTILSEIKSGKIFEKLKAKPEYVPE